MKKFKEFSIYIFLPAAFIIQSACANANSDQACDAPTDKAPALVKLLRVGVNALSLDPLALPNKTVDVPMLGSLALHGGKVAGLSTLRRMGSVLLTADDMGFNMSADMGTGHLAVNYTTTLASMFISHVVVISVNIQCTRIALHINQTADNKIALRGLNLKTLEGLEVKLHSIKLTDPFFNLFLLGTTTVLKKFIEKAAEIAVRQVTLDLIAKINAM
uniref:Putative conserved plasma membrane protein n=1 Tax=Amblyomma triste TaxID=251400 RepID=A0A023G1S0_AMBTT